ncbi:hypothetical protein ACQ4PT_000304 [Festuca glaucescens]
MSKKAAEVGGERPPSHGRATSRAARHHNASAQREEPAVPAAMREDAAGSSSTAMAARPRRAPNEHVTFREAGTSEASVRHSGREGRFPGGPSHGGAEDVTDVNRPYYIPAWRRRRERPPEERRTAMRPIGAPPLGPRPTRNGGAEDVIDPAGVSPPTGRPYYIPPWQRRREQPAEERRTAMRPVGAPPLGPRPIPKIVERVSTIKPDDGGGAPWRPTRHSRGKSPVILSPDRRKRRRRPAAFCFTLCSILFLLAVILVGAAVLTVYLVYRPWFRLTDASLNAGYIDDLTVRGGPPRGLALNLTVPGGPPRGLALNANLTVLAAITSPNTKIKVVLSYMQLDLYFEGHLIGTQTVLPAPVPLRESPGGFLLPSVDIVVSEVPISQEDAYAWRNATTHGGLVVFQLAGRFHTQLNFGKWLPYRYWVNSRCTLWLDPPPSGRLRGARC